MALGLGIHRGLVKLIPKPLFKRLLRLRSTWYARSSKAIEGASFRTDAGIVGLTGAECRVEAAERELLRMLESMHHEDFYVRGMLIDESLGVYVGWVEPGKDSFSDGMPLRSEPGDVVLVFSGEEFPDPGPSARSRRVVATETWWGLPIWFTFMKKIRPFRQRIEREISRARHRRESRNREDFNDRYGMHRIYYHESKDAFYFAARRPRLFWPCVLI